MNEPAMETLDEHQCERLLGSKDIGRIAFSLDGVPEIFPVNYATDRLTVVFRTADGTLLQQATMLRVAFEVDDWDPATGIGWSVVVKGVLERISGGIDPFARALRSREVVPLAPGARECRLAIYPSEVTGRRFRR